MSPYYAQRNETRNDVTTASATQMHSRDDALRGISSLSWCREWKKTRCRTTNPNGDSPLWSDTSSLSALPWMAASDVLPSASAWRRPQIGVFAMSYVDELFGIGWVPSSPSSSRRCSVSLRQTLNHNYFSLTSLATWLISWLAQQGYVEVNEL